jgi:hypothetical protein
MTTIDLSTVTGGVWSGNSREQLRERRQQVCETKDARAQYNQMLKQMVPDTSEAPGFKRRVVKSVGELCGWPFPG